ncbi:DUF4126 family protein [Rhizobium sp. 2MFCol3.1]|uniref:DUF4126 family protein n=1 Tax=Rhizobium sp. 2MFCol3.1 TaxID=1246459 RepID=UPI00036EE9B2|nr:DUF4126 family protein [Rhizobium sp. 2MFCol3.1]
MLILLAFLIGCAAGLRAFTAPTAVSWGALLMIFDVPAASWLSFMASKWTAGIMSVLACFEFFTDKRPSTPSRLVPVQFSARLLTGALAGATLGAAHESTLVGAVAGILGSIAGTLGGSFIRRKMAQSFGRDLPAALTEDAVCIALAVVSVSASQFI